ncbi:glycosyltransferase family 4 protein [Glycomyces paridis]|uniref:glycosyltransferase family 4 protein n=1 Tax=Glycomyces paridis TaxID=2126555 RepID=UPI00130521C6|nr:glycosyltransferase family 4 protein [Glycomyces paridis]
MSNRRIALVLGPSTGGVGTHVASVATGLVARGDAVTVVGPPETEERFGFRATGARFISAPITSKPSPGLPAAWWAVSKALRGITGRGVDVVHAHGMTAGMTALAARPAGAALVTTWHNTQLATGVKRQAYDFMERRLARGVDVALAISPDLHSHLVGLGAVDARLAQAPAPPLRPAGDPKVLRAQLGIGDRPLILSVGRLNVQKDHDTLIAAAKRWTGLDPAPVVAIAGDGPERDRLQALIDASGADVRLLGHRGDIADLLAAADLVVNTSTWEGYPLSLQEALQAGLPLVATRTGGIPDLVGEGAILFPVGDVDAFDAHVRALLADPERLARLAAAGRAQAATWPDEERVIDVLDALYLELTGR